MDGEVIIWIIDVVKVDKEIVNLILVFIDFFLEVIGVSFVYILLVKVSRFVIIF